QSSVTPRNRDPPPSSPAASAPCSESGADRYVTRAAIAVGVNPWSASATSTASNTRVSDGVGRRSVTSQKASSPKLTLPIRSAVRSWPSSLIWSAVEVPSEVGKERPAESLIPPPPAPAQDAPASGGFRLPAGPGTAAAA